MRRGGQGVGLGGEEGGRAAVATPVVVDVCGPLFNVGGPAPPTCLDHTRRGPGHSTCKGEDTM